MLKTSLLFIICFLTGCNPAEIAIAEELTEEVLVFERDLMHPPQVVVTQTLKQVPSENVPELPPMMKRE
jgi:hypothetical protein